MKLIKRYHPRMDCQKVNKEQKLHRILSVFCFVMAFWDSPTPLWVFVWISLGISLFYWDILLLIQTMSEGYRLLDEGICFWHKYKKHQIPFHEIHHIYIVNKSINGGDITGMPFIWLIGGKETGVEQYCMRDRNKNCRVIDKEIAQILMENNETENNYGFVWNRKEIHKLFQGYQGEYYVAESIIRDFPNEYDDICEQYDIKERIHVVGDLTAVLPELDELLEQDRYDIYHNPDVNDEDIAEIAGIVSSNSNIDLMKYFDLSKCSSKFCWLNFLRIIEKMPDEDKARAIPLLFILLQDANWPTYHKTMQLLESFAQEFIMPYVKRYLHRARTEDDEMWVENIELLEEKLQSAPKSKAELHRTAKAKKRKKGRAKIIGIILFTILSMFLAVGVLVEIKMPIVNEKRMLSIVFFDILLIAVVWLKLVEKHKKYVTLLYVIDGILLIMFYGYLFMGLRWTAQAYNFHGNNSYTHSYVHGIGGEGYDNIDEAIADTAPQIKNGVIDTKEIYRLTKGDYTWVFLKATVHSQGSSSQNSSLEIIAQEFYKENNRYYYRGLLTLVYENMYFTSDFSYSDVETVKADIANTTFWGRDEKGRERPIWGVSESIEIINIAVNGERLSYVNVLQGNDGGEYYFWLIEDIGKIENSEDVENLVIEGI